ncbi:MULTISPECIES: CcmD family protein [Arcicella]|uniref:CcmD family protein n=1 Tax=Arcicella aquatica TaxID=217141 RepID=A0ABU5QI40_9BACT|nr:MULTISPECIES: CcmD family protein [Arcicella]MDR6560737.1 CcmD family protein [Arcicella sp. BE51]MDR6810621.1 CcmD family protein [Arcicella sp. BE140]MDR6821971.1 CcmD family protein [Arcicella sp. BE139]MEA5256419.1 CcmD family protein [Arcicella aquatica]
MKKSLSLIICLLISVSLFAQDNAAGEPEMADKLFADGRIYVVVAVVATIFAGIIVYLINLDSKITKLEKQLKK